MNPTQRIDPNAQKQVLSWKFGANHWLKTPDNSDSTTKYSVKDRTAEMTQVRLFTDKKGAPYDESAPRLGQALAKKAAELSQQVKPSKKRSFAHISNTLDP